MVKLSERLQNIADLVTPGLNVADIGCDHAYLAIYLMENNIAKSVIASDVKTGPLEKAELNVEVSKLSDKIKLRLSDGLKAYKPGEVDCIVMSGMGGNLCIKIMSESKDVLDAAEVLILQPQSEIAKVRHYLKDSGYVIISESIVYEDGKFYPMMKAVKGDMKWDKEIHFVYGKILMREQNPVLRQFLIEERDYYVNLYQELSCDSPTGNVLFRLRQIEESLALNEEAMNEISSKNIVDVDRTLK